MNNKLFIGLVLGMLVFGLALGGAFAGGVAYGRGSQETPAAVAAPEVPSPSGTLSKLAPVNPDEAAALRERLQSGNLSPEQLQQVREQFRRQGRGAGLGGGGFRGPGFGGGNSGAGNLTGTVEAVSENAITVNTPQGRLEATLGPDTVIRDFVEVGVERLTVDARVTVTGERGDDGGFDAASIIIVPEDLGLGGFDGLQGDRRQPRAP